MRQDVSAAFFLSQYEKAGLITAIISPFLNLWESKQVIGFLQTIEDDKRRNDSLELLKIMEEVTGDKAVMWGKSIVGFGNWHYKYASGREGDWFRMVFLQENKPSPFIPACILKALKTNWYPLVKFEPENPAYT